MGCSRPRSHIIHRKLLQFYFFFNSQRATISCKGKNLLNRVKGTPCFFERPHQPGCDKFLPVHFCFSFEKNSMLVLHQWTVANSLNKYNPPYVFPISAQCYNHQHSPPFLLPICYVAICQISAFCIPGYIMAQSKKCH